MIAYGHFDFFVIQQFLQLAVSTISQQLAPDAKVLRFAEDGSVAPAGADGNVARLEFTMPHLPGMTELVVQRADVSLQGRRVDQPLASTAKNAASPQVDLTGRPGALTRLEIAGMTVPTTTATGPRLTATSGSPSRYHWFDAGSGVELGRTGGGHQLHLMLRPRDPSGGFGPPAAAVPHYDMPGSSGLYGEVLGGASLRLDVPSAGTLRIDLDPPIDAEAVQVYLGTNGENGAHAGLPHEAAGVAWTATQVSGTWRIAPTGVKVHAAVGVAAPVLVGDFAGEFPTATTLVDFTPAARSLLGKAYDPAGTGDLVLGLDAESESAGELVATGLRLTAHYRLDSIGPDGVPVTLRGGTESVELPVAAGLTPHLLEVTVDGRFGPGVLVAGSDRDRPGRRAGMRLRGAVRAMRRLPLTIAERQRPLFRVGLLGRSTEEAEVLVQLHRDQGGRPGAALGDPAALQVPPAPQPAWHRVELAAPTDAPAVEAVWVTARVSTGTFWWYADPGDAAARAAQVSTDDGATWAASPSSPCTQVHYRSGLPEPGRIAVGSSLGELAADLLALDARRTLIETTGLESLDRGLAVATDGSLAATQAAPTTVAVLERPPASVTFRKEKVRPVPDGRLGELSGLGDALTLTFACDRDADFRVLDATLTYDPWRAA